MDDPIGAQASFEPVTGARGRRGNSMPRMAIPLIIAALMCAASVAAILVRPRDASTDQSVSLEKMIPNQFGDWREASQGGQLQVINPQLKELIDKSYTQVLSRTYVNGNGYPVMLSVAYGANQREQEAHMPEVCYPAQGFAILANEAGLLETQGGKIPVRRLFARMGTRQEPLTYWFAVGGKAIHGKLGNRLIHLRYGLAGRIPDGILFRVSSNDADPARAYRLQADFVNQLLDSVPPDDRKRLSGVGGA